MVCFREQNLCIKCGDLSGVKKAIQTTAEIQSVLENLDKKENYIASSNPGTETAVLFALNLKDGEVQEFRATQQQTQKFPPEYMVQLELVECSKEVLESVRNSILHLKKRIRSFLVGKQPMKI